LLPLDGVGEAKHGTLAELISFEDFRTAEEVLAKGR
jgi:hypothetical protein